MYTASNYLQYTFYFALFIVFNNFSVTDANPLVSFALKTRATIPPNLDAIFQLWILMRILFIS